MITVVVGLIIAAAAPFLAMPIADALAKGGNLNIPAGHYLFVGMLGAPVIGVGLLMSSFLGVENHLPNFILYQPFIPLVHLLHPNILLPYLYLHNYICHAAAFACSILYLARSGKHGAHISFCHSIFLYGKNLQKG